MYPYIYLFNFRFASYWFVFIVGSLIVISLFVLAHRKFNYSLINSIILEALILILSLFGVYLLGYIQSKFESFNASFMGALIFTPILIGIISYIFKKDYYKDMSYSCLNISVVGGIMKIGCFLSGCCGGITINNFQFPVQIVEAIISFLIFVLLIFIWQKNYKFVYPLYLIIYSTTRFMIEFLRDTRPVLGFLSQGQLTAIIVLIIGIIQFSKIYYVSKNVNFIKVKKIN